MFITRFFRQNSTSASFITYFVDDDILRYHCAVYDDVSVDTCYSYMYFGHFHQNNVS